MREGGKEGGGREGGGREGGKEGGGREGGREGGGREGGKEGGERRGEGRREGGRDIMYTSAFMRVCKYSTVTASVITIYNMLGLYLPHVTCCVGLLVWPGRRRVAGGASIQVHIPRDTMCAYVFAQ